MSSPEAHNMRLIAHDNLLGHGNVGEGISIQLAKDGRRILWLAHEAAPKNFTGVDITDPRKPKVIIQTDIAHNTVRSNSLDVVGDMMAVAYQVETWGQKPAGVELFDISTPEEPKSIGFYDASSPNSRGAHQVWFVEEGWLTCAAPTPDFRPREKWDDQPFLMLDISNPSKPREECFWWLPGVREGDDAPVPPRHPRFNQGWRCHNTNVYPERPDRAYLGYIDGGTIILDISDKSAPRMVSHWNPNPPQNGFTHTAMPLFDRDLLIVTDECVYDLGEDWPKRHWVVDARIEEKLVPISTLPMPPVEEFAPRGGRYGGHNVHENRPGPAFRSSEIIIGSYFNGGVRVHSIADPYEPKEIAYYVPEGPAGSKFPSVQINDVYVDENEIVYAVDRWAGGLYVLEMDI
ncbi:MAG: LVIVD repeat-containing protein [Hyphomicrobiaceae bacterium]